MVSNHKNSAPLKNLAIVVTRPEQQAQTLCSTLSSLGAQVFSSPTIVIKPVENTIAIEEPIKQLTDYDLAIFISQNAVIYSLSLIRKYWPTWPSSTKVASVGNTTADLLRSKNLPVDFCPKNEFSSEGLLDLPDLQSLSGKKIILFKGEGGRELLAETFRHRGAKVTEVPVYRREMPQTRLQFLLPERKIDIIICTSKDGLQNLASLVDVQHRPSLLNMRLLVISERMSVQAKQLGFVKPPLIADNATDTAIVEELVTWQEKLHGK